MSGISSKTKVMMVRLPIEVAVKVEHNASAKGVTVSEYLRRILMVQVLRKR